MEKIRVGFALCGSFCTFSKVIPQMMQLTVEGYDVFPIMSETAFSTDTRFGTAESFIKKIHDITGHKIIHTITDAEPIGPQKMFDLLIIEPCTGNTLAKLANGIADSSVTMAAKSHLRNSRPLVIAVSTNDGLGVAAKNIGTLQNCKNVFFVPYSQDDPIAKPNSLVAIFDKTSDTIKCALEYNQIQPVLNQ